MSKKAQNERKESRLFSRRVLKGARRVVGMSLAPKRTGKTAAGMPEEGGPVKKTDAASRGAKGNSTGGCHSRTQ